MEEFFKKETGRSIDDLFLEETDYNHIVLMDETQKIFEISYFWTMFKDVDQPVQSQILAFVVNGSKIPFDFSSAIIHLQKLLNHVEVTA